MPIFKDEVIPQDGMNLDISEAYMPRTMVRFLKGWYTMVNKNSSSDVDGGMKSGANALVSTKNQRNELFASVTLPTGVNKSIGGGYVQESGKYYSCLWNGSGNHSIWELDAKNRTIKKVIENLCLGFVYLPEHFISNIRFTYTYHTIINKVTGVEDPRTYIFITDNNSRTKQIQVEDSIATNGFTHSFFTSGLTCCEVCNMITMGFPAKPNDCISITPVSRPDTPEEKEKTNAMNFKTWQWRLKYIDVWGKSSFHGVISDQYYNSNSVLCSSTDDLLPRCVDLEFDAGCKAIACIVLEYSNCNGISGESDWKEHTTICKYNDCDDDGNYIQEFWLRDYKDSLQFPVSDTNDTSFDPISNKITYRFCGNKECKSIAPGETALATNYIANKSNSVFRLGNKIGTANNERGMQPLLCDEKDKIVYEPVQTGDTDCDLFKMRKIVVWFYIYSPIDNVITNVRKFASSNSSGIDSIGYGQAGDADGGFDTTNNNPVAYRQKFSGTTEGFPVYLVGTDIVGTTQQYSLSTQTFVGPSDTRSNSSDFIQRVELLAPSGKYILRVGAPDMFPHTDMRKSSANMIGLTSINIPGVLINEQYEVEIDVCNGDFELFDTPVMIWDLTCDQAWINNLANVCTGNVYNNITPQWRPVETATVLESISPSTTVYQCQKTNYNGYYFITTRGDVTGDQCKANITLISCTSGGVVGNPSNNVDIFVYDQLTMIVDTWKIKGRIRKCGSNVGIPKTLVVYSNGPYAETDNDGFYEIETHGTSLTRPNDHLLISNGNNSCFKSVCGDNCDPCFDVDPAFNPIPVPTCAMSPREVTVPDLELDLVQNSFRNGLWEGRYGIVVVLEDCLGMETFGQANDKAYVEITDMDTATFIGWDITGLVVPTQYKSLSFYVSENLTYEDYMEWIVDYAILEDNNGNIGSSAATPVTNPSRIRIYINSLIYYTAYGNTNTSWQFLPGDIMKLVSMSNGDALNISKLVSYKEGDNYVTIDYDELTMQAFANNATGTKIRLLRPRSCKTTELFYQICGKIDIIGGVPQVLTGTLSYGNAFKLQRSIPVYVNVQSDQQVVENVYGPDGKIIGTTTVTKYFSVPTNTNTKRTYSLNHHSPSDFFGDHCWGRGRVTVKNEFEKVQRFSTEISLSKGISAGGNTDYLHWFEKIDSISNIDEQTYHAITGVVCQQNLVLVICPNDSFVLMYNQNEFTVQNGQILVNSGDTKFGKPRSKIGDEYGCQQGDINTIFYRNGLVGYLDSRRGCIVKHNFDAAEDVTPFGLKSWLIEKIKTHEANNLDNDSDSGKKFFHAIICPMRKDYILTSFQTMVGDLNYVNNLLEPDLLSCETIAVDLDSKLFKYELHFTPEMFGYVESAYMGQQLMSFKGGKAYIHYPVLDTSDVYLNYYGVQCKPVIELIFNIEKITDKNWLWLEAKLKQHQLYADRVMTESGQESRIMPLWWSRVNNGWQAPFMCQTNAQADGNLPTQTGLKAIMDGITTYGKWVKVRLVTKDEDDSKYAELISVSAFFEKLGK